MQRVYNWRRGHLLTSVSAVKEFFEASDIPEIEDRACAIRELYDDACTFLYGDVVDHDDGTTSVRTINWYSS